MPPGHRKLVVLGSRMQLLAWYTYSVLIWGLKGCMLFFFKRLTLGLEQARFIKWLAIICAVTWLGCKLLSLNTLSATCANDTLLARCNYLQLSMLSNPEELANYSDTSTELYSQNRECLRQHYFQRAHGRHDPLRSFAADLETTGPIKTEDRSGTDALIRNFCHIRRYYSHRIHPTASLRPECESTLR